MYSRLVVSVSKANSSRGLELAQPVGELRLGGDGFVVARRGRDDLRAVADAGGGRRAGDDRLAAGGGAASGAVAVPAMRRHRAA